MTPTAPQPVGRRLRRLSSDDTRALDAVLALNQRCVPRVGSLVKERLVEILDLSAFAVVAESRPVPGPGPADPTHPDRGPDPATWRLDGAIVVLGPGVAYDSPNYRYYEERLSAGLAPGPFRYVDRIVVAPDIQRRGVGRRLYEAVFDDARHAGAAEVTCEVNLDPPNPGSQAFHRRLGFVEVARQWTYGRTVEVQLLALSL